MSVVRTPIKTGQSLFEQIEEMHTRYLEDEKNCETDCYYILNATVLVLEYFSEEYAMCWDKQAA